MVAAICRFHCTGMSMIELLMGAGYTIIMKVGPLKTFSFFFAAPPVCLPAWSGDSGTYSLPSLSRTLLSEDKEGKGYLVVATPCPHLVGPLCCWHDHSKVDFSSPSSVTPLLWGQIFFQISAY